MANIALLENDIVVNVIVAESVEKAEELFPDAECIDISEPILLTFTNGYREFDLPTWVGIDWARNSDGSWKPPFEPRIDDIDFDPAVVKSAQTPVPPTE